MLTRDMTGTYRTLHVPTPKHIFIEPLVSTGVSPGGILISEPTDYPKTLGTIMAVHSNRTYIDQLISTGLEIGQTIIYARYATELVLKNWDWEEIEHASPEGVRIEMMYVGRELHLIHLDDVEAVF